MSFYWFTVPQGGYWREKYNSLFKEGLVKWEIDKDSDIKENDYLYIAWPMKLIDIFKVTAVNNDYVNLSIQNHTILWNKYYGPIPIPEWKNRYSPTKFDLSKKNKIIKRRCSVSCLERHKKK